MIPLTLAHEVVGQGPPVVLIHAFPLSREMWRAQWNALQRRIRVIAPDLPGFGQSLQQAKPSIPQMAREIAGLLDQLKVREPVVICGLSMGGYVTFEFLRQFPQRVRALGLFSTRAVADTPEGREGRLKAAQKIRSEGLEAFSRTILPKLVGKTTLESRPAVVQEITRMILANQPEGVADALLAMADRQDSTELLASISCPTLVVAGEEDSFIPASDAQAMASRIPGTQLQVIHQAGHLVNLEQPVAFQAILSGWLEISLKEVSP